VGTLTLVCQILFYVEVNGMVVGFNTEDLLI